jgi:hypothetical protein
MRFDLTHTHTLLSLTLRFRVVLLPNFVISPMLCWDSFLSSSSCQPTDRKDVDEKSELITDQSFDTFSHSPDLGATVVCNGSHLGFGGGCMCSVSG